ncbi:hypothetical protein ES703_125817 [subsurface metagenome]
MPDNIIDVDVTFSARINKRHGLISIPAHIRKNLNLKPYDSVVVRLEKIIKHQGDEE